MAQGNSKVNYYGTIRLSTRELIEMKDKRLIAVFEHMDSAVEIRKWLLWNLDNGREYLYLKEVLP